ncbi:hypothetical protein ACFYKX_10630 [Cytobacillus sp. FJAT-54145]|uniref:Uncharacterized protein n=1 Tax=Cytobacillus spartinae TaxID=3299023 RepID=A0ABW6KA32_9BACI
MLPNARLADTCIYCEHQTFRMRGNIRCSKHRAELPVQSVCDDFTPVSSSPHRVRGKVQTEERIPKRLRS